MELLLLLLFENNNMEYEATYISYFGFALSGILHR